MVSKDPNRDDSETKAITLSIFVAAIISLLIFFYFNSSGERVFVGKARVTECLNYRYMDLGVVEYSNLDTQKVRIANCRKGARVEVYKVDGLTKMSSYYMAVR